MKMKVIVTGKDKGYGHSRIYPACRISKAFASLLKRTCLLPEHIAKIKEMGCEVKSVAPELPKKVQNERHD